MDRRERLDDPEETLRAALLGLQSGIWTALPAIYQAPGTANGTANVQPALKVQLPDPVMGFTQPQTMPLCVDCPIMWPGGGGYQITFPLVAGDDGLLVFASRCIDAWWQSGGVQAQAEIRMHDLSDGFFFPGLLSQLKAPATAPSTNSVQFRTAAGAPIVDIKSGTVSITADVIVTGKITATGNITAGQGGADQIGLQTHKHPANNQPPIPGT